MICFSESIEPLFSNVFITYRISGGVADTIDSVTSNEMTSNHLKPKSLANADKPEHVVDGVMQGTTFLGQTVAHGFAGTLFIIIFLIT